MDRFFLSAIAVSICFVSSAQIDNKNFNQKLWYNYPAKFWNSQALHLGNSYFGASFFGGLEKEIFSLSEKSMWTGGPAMGDWEKAGVNPKAKSSVSVIRDAVVNGNARLADSLINSNVFGSSELFGNFTSVGDLQIECLQTTKEVRNYKRTLDLENALGTVEYGSGRVSYRREYFCSYPDKILAMKFSADKPGSVSLSISIKILQDSSQVVVSDNSYIVNGWINGNHRPFQVCLKVKNKGGKVQQHTDRLEIVGADHAEVYLTMATNYELQYPGYIGQNPDKVNTVIMRQATGKNYEELKRRHIADYKKLYDRVSLKIEGNVKAEQEATNVRYEQLKRGIADPGYKVLAFNLGRYLIISSSRPNTLPANLQGVWNTFKVAPWAGNYQSNINLQEIYWSCGPTNLAECQQPYLDWIADLAKSGKEIAQRVYGTNGWVSHTTGNIWGHAAPIGSHPWGMYPMGAAWHCQHLWDQFAFTQDTSYLRNIAWPLLKEASVFWFENLVPFKNYFITAPSVSAEHGALLTDKGLNPAFHDFKSDNYRYSLTGIYQDVEMIRDLFNNTLKAALIVGEKAFADSLQYTMTKLLPLKIGKYGQLQEWYEDIDNPDCHHRHIAHLYAVCPGNEINPNATPTLAKAAAVSLDMRGDGRYMEQEEASGGNWARAHRMWCWARLYDGNRANKILTELLTDEGFENVTTFQHASYHWQRQDLYMEGKLYCHFQLDASAAVPGCITEMLLQSHMGELHLLPALPDELESGSIRGIKARGNYTVNLEWKNKELVNATIVIPKGKPVPQIRLGGNIIPRENNKRITIVYSD